MSSAPAPNDPALSALLAKKITVIRVAVMGLTVIVLMLAILVCANFYNNYVYNLETIQQPNGITTYTNGSSSTDFPATLYKICIIFVAVFFVIFNGFLLKWTCFTRTWKIIYTVYAVLVIFGVYISTAILFGVKMIA